MGQQRSKRLGDKLSCSICLDLLKEPVTIPCGHSYCMDCIQWHWDENDQKHIHSCPQCRQTFIPRPALVKNPILAELVEELKKTGVQLAPADHRYAGHGDVGCDVCTGRKLKAVKSCLQCLVSYCEQHLQPHYNVAALKKHKLVCPSENFQENICTNHHEVMKIFCRTDQQNISYLRSTDEHKDHCIISNATEKNERQKELKLCRENIHQKIKDREEDVMLFQQRTEAINYSADESGRDSEKIFSELMIHVENRRSDINQQMRSQQETEVYRTRELLQMQKELRELKRKDAELEELNLNEFNFIQISRECTLHSDSESVDGPAASQNTRLRKPPSAGLKKSRSRQVGGWESEDRFIFAETTEPEHAICSPPPTLLDPPIQKRHLQIASAPVQRDTVRTISSHSRHHTVIAPPIIAPPIIAPPISGSHMWINDLPIWSEPVTTIPFDLPPSMVNPFRGTISKFPPQHY